MTKFLWFITLLGSIFGILLLFASLTFSGAPQQGAAAAIAVGLGVLPYCLTRAWSELRGKP